MRALDAHLAEHAGPGPEDFVFPSPQGSVLRASTFRSRFWLPATKRVGLEGLRIHDLRHTAITLWLAAGVPIEEVTLDAGHDDPAFTIRIYVHRRPGAQERSRERLDALLDDIAERPRAPVRRLAS